jgi:hypothetical protein
MSSFEIEGREYLYAQASEFGARSMTVPLGKILSAGVRFTHTYDFGTPTELVLRVAGAIECTPGKEKIRLLAPKVAPGFECGECGRPASQRNMHVAWLGLWNSSTTFAAASAPPRAGGWQPGRNAVLSKLSRRAEPRRPAVYIPTASKLGWIL